MEILSGKQIEQKINRLAIEIVENNFEAKEIILAGINNNGLKFAKLLEKQLLRISDKAITMVNIKLNPANPLSAEIDMSVESKVVKNKPVIVVDDVANTGRTIFFAFKPFLEVLPKKMEVAVLIDRKHKSFPVKVDYVGLSLATTMKDNISVTLTPISKAKVALD
ncbi:MAG: phosphoribosyltransferase family protein [Saprospiraceae bacterium]|nr:phosphoribosyltransferase family protein [Saprospiraceae bacterium]